MRSEPPHTVTSPLILQQLHWLPVKQRIEPKHVLLTFNAIHNPAPPYLSDLFKFTFNLCALLLIFYCCCTSFYCDCAASARVLKDASESNHRCPSGPHDT